MATDERARLQAQAEGGQAGLAAYDRAAAEISERRAESIEAALAESANRTGPAIGDNNTRANQAITNIINAPVDRRLDDISQARGTFTADMDRLAQAQALYMDNVRRTGSRSAIEQRERAAAEARQRAIEDELFNRYGGYQSATEYENAVNAGARQLRDQAYQDALASYTPAQREADRQAASYTAQSANYATRQRLEAQQANEPVAELPPSNAPEILTALERIRRPFMSPAERETIRQTGSFTARSAQEEQQRRANMAAQQQAAANAQARAEQAAQADRMAALQQLAALEAQRAARNTEFEALVGRDFTGDPFARPDGFSGGSIMDPRNLFEFQRDFAINQLGADPLDALGRFAPMSDTEAMEFDLDQADLQQRYLDQTEYGPEGREGFLADLVAQRTGGFDLGSLAAATNMSEDAVAGVVSSPEFQQIYTAAIAPEADRASVIEAVADPFMAAILAELFASLYPGEF